MRRLQFSDKSSIQGEFFVRVLRSGKVVNEYRDANMIMSPAPNVLAHLLAGDWNNRQIAQIGVGTNGGAMPDPEVPALTNSFAKAIVGHNYPASNRVTFSWFIDVFEAVDMDIMEFGLICADNTLFARKTTEVIEKSGDISLQGAWTIIF